MLKPFFERLSGEDAKYLLGLPSLGLTEYEVKALICLAEGVKTPQEVGRIAGIPRTKTYDVLKSLVEKSLAVESEGRPLKYSLRDDALKRIISEVEEGLVNVLSALRDLERVRQIGLRSAIEEDIVEALAKMGFKLTPAKAGKPYLVAVSPQGFRVLVLLSEEELLTGDGLKKVSSLKESEGAHIAVIVASQEGAVKIRDSKAPGILAVEYHRERLPDRLFQIFREVEEAERSFEDKSRRRLELSAEASKLMSDGLSKISNLRRQMPDLPPEASGDFSNRVREIEEGLMKDDLQLKYLDKAWLTLTAEREKSYSNEVALEAEGLIEGLATLVDRLHYKMKDVTTLSEKLRGLINRRRELGFTPLSTQCPEAPSDGDIVSHKDLIRGLEKFMWASKGLGGTSLGVIVGDHGGGKTLLLRYFTAKINRGDFGSVVAAYTTVSDSFLDTYNTFAVKLSTALTMIEDKVEWLQHFSRQRTLLDADRGFRRAVDKLQTDHGVLHVYWLLDEFDRLFKIPEDKRSLFVSEMRAFIEAQAEAPLSVVFALTPEAFNLLGREYQEIASRIPRSSIFRIPPLRLDDLKELVSRSLSGVGEPKRSRLLKPDEAMFRVLLDLSKGNPREVIQILNEALYRASKNGRSINGDFLKTISTG